MISKSNEKCVPFDDVFVIIFSFHLDLDYWFRRSCYHKKTHAITFFIKVLRKMFQCAYLQLRYQHHKSIYHQMLELFRNRNLFTGVALKFFTVMSLVLSSFFCLFTFVDYLCPTRTCGPSPAHILHPWPARPILSPLPFSSLSSFGSSLSNRSLIPLRTWRAWKWLVVARFSLFPYKEMVLKFRVLNGIICLSDFGLLSSRSDL